MMRLVLLTYVALVAAATTPLAAAYNAYLRIEGVPGESRVAGREGWIDITTISHGLTRMAGGAEAQHVDVTLLKQLDSASPLLAARCATGLLIPEAVLDFVRQDETSTRFYRVFLKNVTISLVQLQGATGGDVPLELLGLNFGYIEWTYTEFAASGGKPREHIAYWDVAKAIGGIGSPEDPPPPPGGLGFRASLQMLDGDGETANLSWTSTAGKTYGVYFSPTLDGSFDLLVATVPSAGDGITSTLVQLVGSRGFFIVRELD
jgi:type VI secretion system secreted protein Hcp